MKKIKPTHSNIEHNKGFTLIEVMIAIVILTIGLLALVSVTVMVIKGNSWSQTLTTATTLAKDKMEELKGSSYDNLPLDSLLSTGPDYAKADGTVQTAAAGSYYTRSWTAPGTTTKIITVTVIWPMNQTVQRRVDLKTIRASD